MIRKTLAFLGLRERTLEDLGFKRSPPIFNWKGPVPGDITWEVASRIPITPMVIREEPKTCLECQAPTIMRRYDPTIIEGEIAFKVWSHECPYGHGAYVEFM